MTIDSHVHALITRLGASLGGPPQESKDRYNELINYITSNTERNNPVYDIAINDRVDKLGEAIEDLEAWQRTRQVNLDSIFGRLGGLEDWKVHFDRCIQDLAKSTRELHERDDKRIKELEDKVGNYRDQQTNLWNDHEKRVKELEGYVNANTISTVIEYRDRVVGLEEWQKDHIDNWGVMESEKRIKALEEWKQRDSDNLNNFMVKMLNLEEWKQKHESILTHQGIEQLIIDKVQIDKKVWEEILACVNTIEHAVTNNTMICDTRSLVEAIKKVDPDFLA